MSGVQVKTSRFETGIRGAHLIVAAIGGFLCVALALVSFRYLLRVGGAPPVIEGNLFIEPWLMVYVAGAATALLIGPWQFSSRLRTRLPTLHRGSGVFTLSHAWLEVRPVLCSRGRGVEFMSGLQSMLQEQVG